MPDSEAELVSLYYPPKTGTCPTVQAPTMCPPVKTDTVMSDAGVCCTLRGMSQTSEMRTSTYTTP